MKYDFSSIIDRRGKDSIAIDGIGSMGGPAPGGPKSGFDAIPMWVADMNFATVPAVTQAIIQRLSHPIFGYFRPSAAYFDAIIKWQETQHSVNGLKPEHIGYENGVLGGVISAMNVLCSKGGNVLLHSPTYIGFTSSLKNNGYNMVFSPLVLDAGQVYRMDFEDMEKKIVENNIHTTVFCSPHNPTGRVWEQWELEKAMELFKKHDVYVISDEIWADLILADHHHIPLQSVSEDARQRTVAIYSPSKTFNLAGLVGSYSIVYNKRLRDQMDKEASLSHYNSMNVLYMHAAIAAYSNEGREWMHELLQVLENNINYALKFIKDKFDDIAVSRPQGTYMLFLDCTEYCKKHNTTVGTLQKAGWDVGVAWQDGCMFNSPCHIRMNLALPFARVQEAFRRLDEYVFNPK